MEAFGQCLQSKEKTTFLTENKTQLWIPWSSGELTRMPMTDAKAPDSADVQEILGLSGIHVLTYLIEPTAAIPANCFLYLCRNQDYDLQCLTKNGRKTIRRGLRNVSISRLEWDEFEEKGYEAYAETDIRHGYRKPSIGSFSKFVAERKDSPFYEAWGSWSGEELLSWLVLFKVDDWALFEASPSRDIGLLKYANNALRFVVLHSLLFEEKRREVLTGLSSINPNSDPETLYVYNTRMGFEAVPFHRVFAPARWLKVMTKPRIAARFWSLAMKVFPQISAFNKLAGMSRLLSGLEADPLGWAKEL